MQKLKSVLKPITYLKLLSVVLLNAGSVGLLWHQIQTSGMWGGNDYFRIYFGAPESPTWLPDILQGWFARSALIIYWVFQSSLLDSALYLLANIFCVLSLFSLPFIQRRSVRLSLGIFALLLFAYDLTILDISGGLPTANTTSTMLMNFHFGLEGAALPYMRDITANVLFVLLVSIPILIQPRPVSDFWRAAPATILVVTALLMAVIQYRQRPGLYAPSYPSPFMTALHLFDTSQRQPPSNIDAANYAEAFGSQIDKVIFIVDESVRGGYASAQPLNTSATPFLRANAHRVSDFGIASSSANCSIDARLSFRHMLTRSQADMPIAQQLSRATFWQYARRAGYQTIHFDAFGSPITLTSGMGQLERSFVDSRIAVMDMPHHTRDVAIAKRLRKLVDEPGRKFVFVEKYGAHVPYTTAYPMQRNPYGADLQQEFNLTDRKEIIKHYKNAINWTTDNFFTELLSTPLPNSVLIIYTSDHGQSLSEGGIKLSHCSSTGKMRAGEASVPILAHSTDLMWQQAMHVSAKGGFGRFSHYQIVPTLLIAMGYRPEWVHKAYDPSLLVVPTPGEKRMVRFGNRLTEFDEEEVKRQDAN